MLEKNPDNLRETPDGNAAAVDAIAFAGVEAQAFDEAVQDGVFVSSEMPDNQGYGSLGGRVWKEKNTETSEEDFLAAEASQQTVSGEPWPPSPLEMCAIAERLHPGVKVAHAPLTRFPSRSYCHFKRAADVICAAVALVVLSPILLACAIAVKATSPGPVLFRQERWGRRRARFECWKLRTMVVETPPCMPAQDFDDKARFMTPVGDFLRRWSLDELPQLINILKGDMSVVGPRPVIVRESRLIDLREPLNADAVRPGLTGWAQVNGRNLVDDEEKALLDGEYVANMAMSFDVRVFFRTMGVVLSRRGVDRDRKSKWGTADDL